MKGSGIPRCQAFTDSVLPAGESNIADDALFLLTIPCSMSSEVTLICLQFSIGECSGRLRGFGDNIVRHNAVSTKYMPLVFGSVSEYGLARRPVDGNYTLVAI